jgi:hypothetical protein
LKRLASPLAAARRTVQLESGMNMALCAVITQVRKE